MANTQLINSVPKFEGTLKVLHCIDTKSLKYESKLFIDLHGDTSYTNNQTHEVHLGVEGITNLYDGFLKTPSDMYSAIDFVRMHECCHLFYTGGRSYAFAIQQGIEEICKYIASQKGEPTRFRNKQAIENYLEQLNKEYSAQTANFIQHMAAGIANSLEDGRIERIYSAKNPGFAKNRLYYRGTCGWNTAVNTFAEYDELIKNPINHLYVLTNQVLSLATTQVYQKGFATMYGTTPLFDEVQELIPYISQGYLAKSTRAMADACKEICKCLAPIIFDAIKTLPKIENDASLQFLKELLAKLLEELANSDDFGNNDSDAQDDDTDSINSTLPVSNLTITLPDDVYDKLQEKAKDGNGSGRINIQREHPLEDEDKDDESNSEGSLNGQCSNKEDNDNDSSQSSSGGSGQAGEGKQGSETQTSQSDSSSQSSQSETKSDSQDAKPNQESQDKPGSKQNSSSSSQGTSHSNSSSGGGGGSEEELQKAMQEAAETVRAQADEALDNINKASINKSSAMPSSKNPSQKEVIDTSAPIPSSEMKDICDFTEYHREYKVKTELPPELKMKGSVLHKKIERYFKSLMTPCVKNRRNGLLDTSALSNLAKQKTNVFMKKGKSKQASACVYILLDNSGSMIGNKRRAACKAAAVIEEGFKGLMPMKIVAFDSQHTIVHEVIKNWEESLRKNCCWNFCLHGRDGYGNEDGYDIQIATRELLKRSEQKKMLIVLSDGAPSNTEHVRQAVEDARKKGIKVSSIYFKEGSIYQDDIDTFAYMYQKDYICCKTDKIMENLETILQKFAHSK